MKMRNLNDFCNACATLVDGDGYFRPSLQAHGTQSVRLVLAKHLGWSRQAVTDTISWIAENPQFGVAAIISMGPSPSLFFSNVQSLAPSGALLKTEERLRYEVSWRALRYGAKVGLAWVNLKDRQSPRGKRLRTERTYARAMITNLAAAFASQSEHRLLAQADEVLKLLTR